jgi:hypothetical protein
MTPRKETGSQRPFKIAMLSHRDTLRAVNQMPSCTNAFSRNRLVALASYAPKLAAEDFSFGTWHDAVLTRVGTLLLGHVALSAGADAFVTMLYDEGWVQVGFDWVSWKGSDEASSLRDDRAVLSKATEMQLARLLTTLVRQDRFVEV